MEKRLQVNSLNHGQVDVDVFRQVDNVLKHKALNLWTDFFL